MKKGVRKIDGGQPIVRFQHSGDILNRQSYQFCTTPFGLSLVPWLFTKITRPILEWARSLNIRISAYLDDWIIVADSPEQSIHHTNVVLQKLRCLGWLGNLKKSILTPCQTLEHLGFSLNTIEMTAHLPGKKLRDIRRSIQQILKKPVQSPRTIHSLTMRIQAATFAILPARMYTQYLLRLKNQTVKTMKDWDLPQPLTPECLKELNWWKTNIGLCNGRNILPQTPQETIFVDASNSGWGCSISPDPQTSLKTAHGYWNHEESQMSINWRELKAAQIALQLHPNLRNKTVLIRTDNTTSMAYINKQGGTRSFALVELATTLWKWCLQRGISIIARHIPGAQNQIADYVSRRTFTKNCWQIKPHVFQAIIQQKWGPYCIDLFADKTNHLLPKYVSWHPDPGALLNDAFSVPWSQWSNPYIHPPWNLVLRCLEKIRHEQLPQVTMVTPYWTSAMWFPLLLNMSLSAPILLDQTAIQCTTPLTPWPLTDPSGRLSVWRLSGVASKAMA